MRTIYLIRHAESTGTRYNRNDFPPEGAHLSAFGEKQTVELRKTLKNRK